MTNQFIDRISDMIDRSFGAQSQNEISEYEDLILEAEASSPGSLFALADDTERALDVRAVAARLCVEVSSKEDDRLMFLMALFGRSPKAAIRLGALQGAVERGEVGLIAPFLNDPDRAVRDCARIALRACDAGISELQGPTKQTLE